MQIISNHNDDIGGEVGLIKTRKAGFLDKSIFFIKAFSRLSCQKTLIITRAFLK